MISNDFLLDSKVALEIQKTRVAVATRIYSQNVEDKIRKHPLYPKLLVLRSDKNADRKETAKLVKKLLGEQLAAENIAVDDFKAVLDGVKKEYAPYQLLLKAEAAGFKRLQPQLEGMPVYAWMKSVKGLGVRFAVKLISKIKVIDRFENPSKLRTYCGTAPGLRMRSNVEANFNPELKGILLGQVAESFIKSGSQYKRVYDEKKQYYVGLHPEALEKRAVGVKVTKDTWTKMRIHNYAKKTMINRFLVDLWMAWYICEGKVPPKNPWIADQPHHSLEPMVVPVGVGGVEEGKGAVVSGKVKGKRGRKAKSQ